jgi:hypothetical protein
MTELVKASKKSYINFSTLSSVGAGWFANSQQYTSEARDRSPVCADGNIVKRI